MMMMMMNDDDTTVGLRYMYVFFYYNIVNIQLINYSSRAAWLFEYLTQPFSPVQYCGISCYCCCISCSIRTVSDVTRCE